MVFMYQEIHSFLLKSVDENQFEQRKTFYLQHLGKELLNIHNSVFNAEKESWFALSELTLVAAIKKIENLNYLTLKRYRVGYLKNKKGLKYA
jgi:hypothetical protein